MKKRELGEKAARTGRRGASATPSAKKGRSASHSVPPRPATKEAPLFSEGQSVELLIGQRTDIGYAALIDGSREGLLYKNEVFQPLRTGQQISGFIKRVRDDGKIDLCLQKPGAEKVVDVAGRILAKLRSSGGFLAVDDDSPPEEIYRLFGVSKKTYKKAIGGLYKERLIVFEDEGIRLAGGAAGRPSKDPLHGVTLEMMLNRLVEQYGWEEMGRIIRIRCFTHDPSVKSSLHFLRRTPWARSKVESLYLRSSEKTGDIRRSSRGKG